MRVQFFAAAACQNITCSVYNVAAAESVVLVKNVSGEGLGEIVGEGNGF